MNKELKQRISKYFDKVIEGVNTEGKCHEEMKEEFDSLLEAEKFAYDCIKEEIKEIVRDEVISFLNDDMKKVAANGYKHAKESFKKVLMELDKPNINPNAAYGYVPRREEGHNNVIIGHRPSSWMKYANKPWNKDKQKSKRPSKVSSCCGADYYMSHPDFDSAIYMCDSCDKGCQIVDKQPVTNCDQLGDKQCQGKDYFINMETGRKMKQNGDDIWPQEDDYVWGITSRGIVDKFYYEDDEDDKMQLEFGNVFKTVEEAEAVRDLRKHEAKCRFTMEDFDLNDDGERISWMITNEFNASLRRYDLSAIHIVDYCDFPTKELAQERAQILKRIAEIRGLI